MISCFLVKLRDTKKPYLADWFLDPRKEHSSDFPGLRIKDPASKIQMWTNYHMHSEYCDGTGKLSDYATTARDLGMRSIGFSSHAPLPFHTAWCMKKEKLENYIHTIDTLKPLYPNLQLYKGMEVDYIPNLISPADFAEILDYNVGSIHFVDHFDDRTPWEIDGAHSGFLEGLEKIFQNNIRDAVSRYFELTREMVEKARPSIVGHLDKIKIQNQGGKFYSESDSWYQEAVTRTLNVMQKEGSIIEVNTRGIYQKKSDTTYPGPWILERIHQRQIPVTLSSDAHHPKDIINQFKETAALLLAIGFRKISILKDGSWKPVTLTPDGIGQ